MKIHREHITLEPQKNVHRLDITGSANQHPYHYHPEWELIWIISGHGVRMVGDSLADFHAGDLVLIGKNLPHQYQASSQALEAVVFQFSGENLVQLLSMQPGWAPLVPWLEDVALGYLFQAYPEHVSTFLKQVNKEKNQNVQLLRIIELLLLLKDGTPPTRLANLTYKSTLKEKQLKRLEEILNHLNDHYTEEITLTQVATLSGMHKQSISRFFQSYIGMTFQEYLKEVRLYKASCALIQTQESITNIAMNVGYSNLSNFNRQFKTRYQKTPSTYRKTFHRGEQS